MRVAQTTLFPEVALDHTLRVSRAAEVLPEGIPKVSFAGSAG